MPEQGYVELIEAARHPDDAVTLAFAGVMAMAPLRAPPYDVPIAGLDGVALAALKAGCFPELRFPLVPDARPTRAGSRVDEFDDLVALLLEHRTVKDDESCWLAHAVATASMGENHLWQDMGLPSRQVLSWLMEHYFTSLFVRNVGDMKWKKFFYRQLCERADVLICKSPSCAECADYQLCFGTEEAVTMPLPRAEDNHACA